MLENPYIAGIPVGGTGAFVGRTDILSDINHILRSPQSSGVVLCGQRRIGKTSILERIEASLPGWGAFHPVRFDLQNKADWPLPRMLGELAQTITAAVKAAATLALPEPGPALEAAFVDQWIPALLGALPEGDALVLLIDEFDVLADPKSGQPRDDYEQEAFIQLLLLLLQRHSQRLRFVLVIGRPFGELNSSVFSLFKLLPSRPVSLMRRDDCEALVRLSEADGSLAWTPAAVERVFALTSGHPLLAQQLCQLLWQQAEEERKKKGTAPPVQPEAVDALSSTAFAACLGSLEWLWRGLRSAERVVASALAEAGVGVVTQERLEQILNERGVRVMIRELEQAPAFLVNWDLIEEVDEGYRFRVELLRQWIATDKKLARIRDEIEQIEPEADHLFKSAKSQYQQKKLDLAVELLRQVIQLNPNHFGGSDLLADILQTQGKFSEARQLLMQLRPHQPAVRHRLVSVLLAEAHATSTDEERLALYDQVLALAAEHSEAKDGRRRIWRARGDSATAVGRLEDALAAYQAGGLEEQAQATAHQLRARALDEQLQRLVALEQAERYDAALELARELAAQYGDVQDWATEISRLETRSRLEAHYQRAVGALKGNDRDTAARLLVEVLGHDPVYKQAARYLLLAVSNVDVDVLQRQRDEVLAALLKERARAASWRLRSYGGTALAALVLLASAVVATPWHRGIKVPAETPPAGPAALTPPRRPSAGPNEGPPGVGPRPERTAQRPAEPVLRTEGPPEPRPTELGPHPEASRRPPPSGKGKKQNGSISLLTLVEKLEERRTYNIVIFACDEVEPEKLRYHLDIIGYNQVRVSADRDEIKKISSNGSEIYFGASAKDWVKEEILDLVQNISPEMPTHRFDRPGKSVYIYLSKTC